MKDKKIAIYIRLSNADEDLGGAKDESNSVVNQRLLINHFLDRSEELSKYPRYEFVDDGFTGTNTSRPSFQRMIEQIRNGYFDICITKDFSRFSRDYIETGDYLECVFPFLNVRYISINDNYDSNDYKGTTGGMDVFIRTLIYDAYSKDLSIKVTTAQKQNAKKGHRVHGLPAYGYRKDPEQTAMDVIDEEAASIVRRIFDMALDGARPTEIARALNMDGILPPGEYYRKNNPDSKKFASTSDKVKWTSEAVTTILKRYNYTGASVSYKRVKTSPCSKTTVPVPREDWIVVPGMHEAIISEEEYDKVQKMLFSQKRKGPDHSKIYPLKSLMFCGACKRALCNRRYNQKKSTFYVCNHRTDYGNDDCYKVRSPREDELHRIIYENIMQLISINVDSRKKKKAVKRRVKNTSDKGFDKEAVFRDIENLKRKNLELYEKYVIGEIDKSLFLEQKQSIKNDITWLEESMLECDLSGSSSADDSEPEKDNSVPDGEGTLLRSVCDIYKDATELTYEMTHAFIERIYVYPDGHIEIVWKFKDCFQDVISHK